MSGPAVVLSAVDEHNITMATWPVSIATAAEEQDDLQLWIITSASFCFSLRPADCRFTEAAGRDARRRFLQHVKQRQDLSDTKISHHATANTEFNAFIIELRISLFATKTKQPLMSSECVFALTPEVSKIGQQLIIFTTDKSSLIFFPYKMSENSQKILL